MLVYSIPQRRYETLPPLPYRVYTKRALPLLTCSDRPGITFRLHVRTTGAEAGANQRNGSRTPSVQTNDPACQGMPGWARRDGHHRFQLIFRSAPATRSLAVQDICFSDYLVGEWIACAGGTAGTYLVGLAKSLLPLRPYCTPLSRGRWRIRKFVHY